MSSDFVACFISFFSSVSTDRLMSSYTSYINKKKLSMTSILEEKDDSFYQGMYLFWILAKKSYSCLNLAYTLAVIFNSLTIYCDSAYRKSNDEV